MRRMLYFALLFTLVGCRADQETIAGGWADQKPEAEIVHQAYVFAKQEIPRTNPGLVLLDPVTAKTQIVAGTNIRLECPYELKGKKGRADVIIFRGLDFSMRVSSLVLDPAPK